MIERYTKKLANTNAPIDKNICFCYQKKKVFKNFYSERLNKKINYAKYVYDDLKCYVYSSTTESNFGELKGLITFLNNTRHDNLTLEQLQNEQVVFNRYLKSIRFGNKSKRWLISICFLVEEIMLPNFLLASD